MQPCPLPTVSLVVVYVHVQRVGCSVLQPHAAELSSRQPRTTGTWYVHVPCPVARGCEIRTGWAAQDTISTYLYGCIGGSLHLRARPPCLGPCSCSSLLPRTTQPWTVSQLGLGNSTEPNPPRDSSWGLLLWQPLSSETATKQKYRDPIDQGTQVRNKNKEREVEREETQETRDQTNSGLDSSAHLHSLVLRHLKW
ncbi:hypothetical protein VTK73DRAFT_5070 [Phialemonium thermophilum]|uniref:Uncharacterized protein n=1 Tax=Phialemonium thermophilum TaxID=223376 RepID=A0ABR3V3S5_9PEZI